MPDTAPNELARILVTGEETQNLTAATPPVKVLGFKIVGACLPATDASPATLTFTPSDASGPFTTFTIPCTGTQHIARVGSATPLTPPYALTDQNAESISSGYAQLLEDNADGTG